MRRDQASGVGYADAECVRYHENCVLAALSWVWDAQQRAHGVYICGPRIVQGARGNDGRFRDPRFRNIIFDVANEGA